MGDRHYTHARCCTSSDQYTTQDTRPSVTGDQDSVHITGETSDGADAGGRAQAEGDGEAGGASGGNGKKREREAGGGQTGRDNETRSETNDATAKTVAQAPESSTPTATPAQVTSKRHKTTASTPSIETS